MQAKWVIMMGDQKSKYLPITKLMQYWIMIRTILHKKNKNQYVNPFQSIMNLI